MRLRICRRFLIIGCAGLIAAASLRVAAKESAVKTKAASAASTPKAVAPRAALTSATLEAVAKTLKPYDGPSARGVDVSTLDRKVMVGYQGWFTAAGDGSGIDWNHYVVNKRFEPGFCHIEYWPDVSELGADEKYPTPFRHADGRVAYVFSAFNKKTVIRHFEWMRAAGIDGAFVQRFASNTMNEPHYKRVNVVLENCREAANRAGRAYAVMYDISSLKEGQLQRVADDWRLLVTRMSITRDPKDQAYLRHKGRPVVAVWGLGFKDRLFSVPEWSRLIGFLHDDPVCGGCAMFLGVPTGWRTLDRDCLKVPELSALFAKADILSPWTVGRYRTPDEAATHARERWAPDQQWCREHGKDYLPVVYPGFSWHNMKGDPQNPIPRLKGQFFWKQIVEATRAGATMLYVAMFDEMDEGTAIFKCENDPPVGATKFLTYEGLPSDFYMRLAGQAGRLLRGEIQASDKLPFER